MEHNQIPSWVMIYASTMVLYTTASINLAIMLEISQMKIEDCNWFHIYSYLLIRVYIEGESLTLTGLFCTLYPILFLFKNQYLMH